MNNEEYATSEDTPSPNEDQSVENTETDMEASPEGGTGNKAGIPEDSTTDDDISPPDDVHEELAENPTALGETLGGSEDQDAWDTDSEPDESDEFWKKDNIRPLEAPDALGAEQAVDTGQALKLRESNQLTLAKSPQGKVKKPTAKDQSVLPTNPCKKQLTEKQYKTIYQAIQIIEFYGKKTRDARAHDITSNLRSMLADCKIFFLGLQGTYGGYNPTLKIIQLSGRSMSTLPLAVAVVLFQEGYHAVENKQHVLEQEVIVRKREGDFIRHLEKNWNNYVVAFPLLFRPQGIPGVLVYSEATMKALLGIRLYHSVVINRQAERNGLPLNNLFSNSLYQEQIDQAWVLHHWNAYEGIASLDLPYIELYLKTFTAEVSSKEKKNLSMSKLHVLIQILSTLKKVYPQVEDLLHRNLSSALAAIIWDTVGKDNLSELHMTLLEWLYGGVKK